jgi:PEP-CTERM motif-containing protein
MRHRVPMVRALAISGLLGLCASSAAQAGPILVTGSVTIVPAPADARLQAFESNTEARLFAEVLGLVLPGSVTVNVDSPGVYPSPPATTGTIGPGTVVESYFLVTDPVGSDPANIRNYVGSITFSTDVLGIILLDPQFAASNAVLGHPGTLYSAAGYSLDPGDVLTLSPDRRTVSINFSSAPAADNLRIITAPIPEPGTLVLLGTGAAAALLRRRRVKKPGL